MTIASDRTGGASAEAMVEACWPEEIPRNYEEMYTMDGAFVASTLRKYNKVGRNYEEMLSYTWERLVNKDVIGLFMSSITTKFAPTMTALEACEYLGVNFSQWRTKMWAFHKGDPIKSKDGTRMIGRRQGGWMPTPINLDHFQAKGQLGYSAKTAVFRSTDIFYLSSLERLMNNGSVRGPFAKQGPMNHPQLKATRGHWRSYVATSIYSDFLNWCRTYRRKWQQDRPMFLRQDDEHEDANWETNLPDPGGPRQETHAALKQAFTKLSETLYEGMRDADKLKCKPVAQTEMEMFELLEQGVPLPEVVKKLDIPDQVRRAVLKSISDLRPRAA